MNKVAVVTGAARGIGLACAGRLAADGYEVIMADRDQAALARGAAGVGSPVVCDVASSADIDALVDRATAAGRLDLIVSNAGVSDFASLQDTSLDDWNRILATNLTASFLLARHAEQALRSAGGSMVLVASTRAHMSEPDTHAYTASKGGLVALGHSLAISLGPQVRVNVVSPGWIDTAGEALDADDHAQHPAGRVGTAADVADAVAYLARAEFVTGAEVVVDGGMTRKMIYT